MYSGSTHHVNRPPSGCEFHFLRECFFHCFQHYVTSLTIYVFDLFNVFVQIVHIQESVSDQLVDCGGLQVSTLFDEVVFNQVFFGCADPADTQTRSQDLGACAQEYNQFFGIQDFRKACFRLRNAVRRKGCLRLQGFHIC